VRGEKVRLRKLLLIMTALAMTVVLAACSGSEDQGSAPSDDDVQAPTAPATSEDQDTQGPADKTLKVTVPAMERIQNSPVPTTVGDDEDALRDYVGIHLEGTGFPWEDEANVYIAGHRLGYPGTDSFLAFYDIDSVQVGDQVTLSDADGKQYIYEVFNVFTVAPTDLYVTEPIQGRNVVTLQTCTLPDYTNRVIVQGELMDSQA
jgi:sortase A